MSAAVAAPPPPDDSPPRYTMPVARGLVVEVSASPDGRTVSVETIGPRGGHREGGFAIDVTSAPGLARLLERADRDAIERFLPDDQSEATAVPWLGTH